MESFTAPQRVSSSGQASELTNGFGHEGLAAGATQQLRTGSSMFPPSGVRRRSSNWAPEDAVKPLASAQKPSYEKRWGRVGPLLPSPKAAAVPGQDLGGRGCCEDAVKRASSARKPSCRMHALTGTADRAEAFAASWPGVHTDAGCVLCRRAR